MKSLIIATIAIALFIGGLDLGINHYPYNLPLCFLAGLIFGFAIHIKDKND